MYVFHLFFFLHKFCQVFWGGGQAPQARVSSPPRVRGKLPRVRGIPRGIFTPEGRQTAQRQLHSPCWEEGGGGEGGGASYPGFKINRYTGSVCLFVYIVAWNTREYTYIFTS